MFANIGVNTAHADTLQSYDAQVSAGEIGFNTVYQDVPQPGAGNGALTVLSEGPTATMTDMMVNNDTVIQTAAVSSSGATTGNFTTGFYADLGGTASNVAFRRPLHRSDRRGWLHRHVAVSDRVLWLQFRHFDRDRQRHQHGHGQDLYDLADGLYSPHY